jgi:hypothetical protein
MTTNNLLPDPNGALTRTTITYRGSGPEEDGANAAVDLQLSAIRQWAARNGYIPVDVHAEVAAAGHDLDKAMERVGAGDLVARKCSHLGRVATQVATRLLRLDDAGGRVKAEGQVRASDGAPAIDDLTVHARCAPQSAESAQRDRCVTSDTRRAHEVGRL